MQRVQNTTPTFSKIDTPVGNIVCAQLFFSAAYSKQSHFPQSNFFIYQHRFTPSPQAIYVVAIKCSRNQLLSENYKTVPSFKLHFLQNDPFVQIYTSASDCKGVRILSVKNLFSSYVAFLMSEAPQKRRPFKADYSTGEQVKISCRMFGRVCGMLQCCHFVRC
jgi:hypothetical protein